MTCGFWRSWVWSWLRESVDRSGPGFPEAIRQLFGKAGDMKNTAEKVAALKALLAGLKNVLVAFSGGVDSAFLMAVAKEAAGDRARAVAAV